MVGLGTKAIRYGIDDHYDVISAFIKSLRGSDVNARCTGSPRMLEAGEDARFIARRMVIFAPEDVGMADPMALLIANAAARWMRDCPGAAQPVAGVHPPRDRAEVEPRRARHLEALGRTCATASVAVPPHLRGTGYSGAAALGTARATCTSTTEGMGRPAVRSRRLRWRVYYEPSDHGFEEEVRRRMGREEDR